MRLGRGVLWTCASVALLTTAFACRQLVGIGDGPPNTGDPLPGSLGYSGACGQCLVDHCRDAGTSCAGVTSCELYTSCLAGCDGDPPCRAQCGADHIVGATYDPGVEITALRVCLGESCAAACNIDECSNVFSDYVSPPDAARACETCFAPGCGHNPSDAGPPLTALQGDSLARCLLACTTLDCDEACESSVIDGALVTISGGVCGDDCAFGGNWECAGRPWPSSNATCTLALSARSDAIVSLCSSQSPTCEPPLAHFTGPGAAGIAQMQVPAGTGIGQYVRVAPAPDAGAAGSGDALVPTLYYWSFPLTQARWDLPSFVVTQDILAGLLADVHAAAIPGRGHMYVATSDCRGLPAPHVVVDLPGVLGGGAGVGRYYWDPSGTPVVDLVETSTQGGVSFTNVPPGQVVVTATPAGFAQPVSRAVVYVNAGEVTLVDLVPTPKP